MSQNNEPGVRITAASLLLALWCAPALASQGHTSVCEALHLETVDLTTSSAEADLTIESTPLQAEVSDVANPLTPNAETILRQIFDESMPEDQEASQPTAVRSPNAAPIAELTAPGLREQSRNIESSESSDDSELDAMDTRVPGLTAEQLRRYRQQMFRTDI